MNHEQNSCNFFLGMKIKFNIKIKKNMYKYLKKIYIVSYLSKVLGNVKKNPYIINQNHIFSKKYCEVISG